MEVRGTLLALAGGFVVLGSIAGAACGGSSTTPAATGQPASTSAAGGPSTAGGSSASSAGGGAPGGEAAGAEAALITTSDPATKISFNRPATWTQTNASPLTFSGPDEYVSVELRPLTGTDVLAAARADEAAVKAAAPGYKVVGIGPSPDLRNAAVLSYEWDLGKSAVTGKPVHERADRYYINAGNGHLVVFTASSPSARFDQQQARDIALTVKVAK